MTSKNNRHRPARDRSSLAGFLLIFLICCCSCGGSEPAGEPKGVLRVAASQFPVAADIAANAGWVRRHMRKAAQGEADIVLFPECALSGYAGEDHRTLEGFDWEMLHREMQALIRLADKLDLWVVLGSTHRLEKHKPHDSLYVIDPDGRLVDRYDKRFLTPNDLAHFSPGDHLVTFDVNGVRCGLLICYDIRFPELYRAYKSLEAQVILQAFYNARQKPGGIHARIMPVIAQARAATNHFFMTLSNASTPHSWPCHLITPDGLIAAKLPADEPGLLVYSIDTRKSYYDASKPYRAAAMRGKLNSGRTVTDPRSQDRRSF